MISWPRCTSALAVLALATGVASCGPGVVNSENAAILSLAGPANVAVAPGESLDLAWILVRQSDGPLPGHAVVFTVIAQGDHGCTLSAPSDVTDTAGLAEVIFTAGPAALALPVQVQGSVTDIPVGEPQPDPVSFTIQVSDAVRALRPVGDTRVAGMTGRRLDLAVRATSGGASPIAGETITWEVTDGGSGDARMLEASTQTDVTGIARSTLECGSVTTTVTLQASMTGTAPVVFTVDVSEWGSCDGPGDCPAGWDCVGGGCVEPTPECATDDECGDGRRCRFGRCVVTAGEPCKLDEECAEGETCVYGFCTDCEGGGCPCDTVDDCPEGFICVDGICVCPPESPDCGGDPTCDVDDPDLEGLWDVDSTLHLREALPDWIDDTLDFLGPPFRFLSDGILGGFDFDIPIIGNALEEAADSLVERYVPRWVGEFMAAIADLNDILSTFRVYQEMTLWGAGVPDQYNGELGWREVEMTWRGDVVRGRIEEITGFHVDHDSIEAEAICGTFYLHRHDVSIAFGTIVRWILDVIVTIVSDGEWLSLEDFFDELTGVCDLIADAVDELAWDLSESLDITLPDVYDIVLRTCELGVTSATDAALDWLEGIMVSSDAMTLGGHATIASPRELEDGRWDGTLIGRDFTGDWTAARR